MKTNTFRYGFLAAVIFTAAAMLMVSCKKDDPEPTDPECQVSVIYLIDLDSNHVPLNNEKDSIVFIHDANNRLTQYRMYDNENISIVYNADGRLEKLLFEGTMGIDGLVFSYSGDVVTATPLMDDEFYFEIVMQMQNKHVVRMDYFFAMQEFRLLVYYVDFTWEAGNLIKVEEYEFEGMKTLARERSNKPLGWLPPMTEAMNPLTEKIEYVLYNTTTFAYDNKKNPFVVYDPLIWLIFDPSLTGTFTSMNNVIQYQGVGEMGNREVTYQIEYNQFDYPAQFVENYGNTYFQKWLFRYSNCE